MLSIVAEADKIASKIKNFTRYSFAFSETVTIFFLKITIQFMI